MSSILQRLAGSAMAVLAGGTVVLPTTGPAQADPPTSLAAASCTRAALFVSGTIQANYVPVTSTGSTNCVLSQGNNSGAVSGLQNNLFACYNRNLNIDGNFGQATKDALIYAQDQMKVDKDGVFGPNTRAKMKMYFALDGTTRLCTVWNSRSWTFASFQY